MADKRITQLNENTDPQNDDLLIIEDISGVSETKKIKVGTLLNQTIGRNLLVNPDFSVSQRVDFGTTVTLANGQMIYAADRWKVYRAGLNGGISCVNNLMGVSSGFPNGVSITRTPGSVVTGTIYLSQTFETTDTKKLVGNHLTFTTQISVGANAAGTLDFFIAAGTASDQTFAGAFATGSTTYPAFKTIPVQSGTISVSTSVPLLDTNQIAVAVRYNPTTSPAVAGDQIIIYGMKLEIGKQFTGWCFPLGADNMLRCQRYYQKLLGYYNIVPVAVRYLSNNIWATFQHNVPMRASPTLVHNIAGFTSGGTATATNIAFLSYASGWATMTGSLTIDIVTSSPTTALLRLTASTSFSGAAGEVGHLYGGTGVIWGWDADL